jgi:hypothetical protein
MNEIANTRIVSTKGPVPLILFLNAQGKILTWVGSQEQLREYIKTLCREAKWDEIEELLGMRIEDRNAFWERHRESDAK